eukprot:201098-Rhodomonas_salina.2
MPQHPPYPRICYRICFIRVSRADAHVRSGTTRRRRARRRRRLPARRPSACRPKPRVVPLFPLAHVDSGPGSRSVLQVVSWPGARARITITVARGRGPVSPPQAAINILPSQ